MNTSAAQWVRILQSSEAYRETHGRVLNVPPRVVRAAPPRVVWIDLARLEREIASPPLPRMPDAPGPELFVQGEAAP